MNKMEHMPIISTYIKPFSTIQISDVAQVGGKNASLGEMFSNLTSRGIQVPDGFAITSLAFEA
jgi:pyruvate, water dikinase